MKIVYLLICSVTILSCHYKGVNNSDLALDTLKNNYATGFRIIDNKDSKTIEVFNPWQNAKGVVIKYNLSKGTVSKTADNTIHVPVKRVVCMSTTHIAFIDALHELPTIKGISGGKLISNNTINEMISKNEITDVGYEQSLNYEILIGLHPDVIFVYGVGSDVSGYINKLKELNIKVVLVGEYLEANPLAKAEWIKFFAEFFLKRELASAVFDTISNDYEKLKQTVKAIKYRPTVMMGLPWNGTWYISGGKSFAATLISDASGEYIWKDIDSHESLPIDLETVFQKSMNADIWLNPGAVLSKKDIQVVDERLVNVKPFIQNRIFNNNARLTPLGGNDYWESGTVNPHLILKDLIAILHPEVFPNYKMKYYQTIK